MMEGVKQSESDDAMMAQTGMADALTRYSDKVTNIQNGISSTVAGQDKKITMDMHQAKQLLMLALEAGAGQLEGLESKLAQIKHQQESSNLVDAVAVAKSAVDHSVEVDKAKGSMEMNLGHGRDDVLDQVYKAVKVMKDGP